MQRFKSFVIIFSLVLSACVSNHTAEQKNESENSSPASPNKAISMSGLRQAGEVYSLYGIKLGETRSSVEDKYRLLVCRKDMFFVRCLISLDTRGVEGISLSDRATIFIAFKNNIVHSMSIPVFKTSLKQAREMLTMLYGEPASVSDNKTTWLNDSGSVVLEESDLVTQPFSVSYRKN